MPRKPLDYTVKRYNQVARIYRFAEPLYLIFPQARRKATTALALKRGDTVLEIGVGTGRNLEYLLDAVGPTGSVIGVDAAAGMLAEARKLIERNGWANVCLVEQNAETLDLHAEVDAVLFSLSYSAITNPRPALERAWALLRPGGRVVVMDAGLTATRLRPLLTPFMGPLLKLGPGDPYSRPWDDLGDYGEVTIERFMMSIYYTCHVEKAP
jgi:ubiquinone/menaquinone biosynthesis C-methylase UbiE